MAKHHEDKHAAPVHPARPHEHEEVKPPEKNIVLAVPADMGLWIVTLGAALTQLRFPHLHSMAILKIKGVLESMAAFVDKVTPKTEDKPNG